MREYFFGVVVLFLLFNDGEAIEQKMPIDIGIVLTAYGKSQGYEEPRFDSEVLTATQFAKLTIEKKERDARISLNHVSPEGDVKYLITFDQGNNVNLVDGKKKDLEHEMRIRETNRADITKTELTQLFPAAANSVKGSRGNRADATDVMVWFIRGECRGAREQLPTDDRLLMFVVQCGETLKGHRVGYVEERRMAKQSMGFPSHLYIAFGRYDYLGNILICFFGSNLVWKSDIAFRSANGVKSAICNFVPTIEKGQCAEGRESRERRCSEKEPKDYGNCSATWGDSGTTKARPANPDNDPIYAHCPWIYNVSCPLKTKRPKKQTRKTTKTTVTGRRLPTDEFTLKPRAKSKPPAGLETWMIVVIVMGTLLPMVAAVAVFIRRMKKRKRRRLEKFYGRGREPPPLTQFRRSYDSGRRTSHLPLESRSRERADHRRHSTQFSRDRRSTDFRGSRHKATFVGDAGSRPSSARPVSQWKRATPRKTASAPVLASRSSIPLAKSGDRPRYISPGPRSTPQPPTSQMGKLPRLPSKSSVSSETPSLPTWSTTESHSMIRSIIR